MFSDGSFVYVPKGVRCPMELSTYFRINAADTGQFERTRVTRIVAHQRHQQGEARQSQHQPDQLRGALPDQRPDRG